jgi:hypothetical protein
MTRLRSNSGMSKLFLSLIAVASLFTARSALASDTTACSFGPGISSYPLCNGFSATVGDKLLTITKEPSLGGGTVRYSVQPGEEWTVDVDFDTPGPLGLGEFEYNLAILEDGNVFDLAGVDSTVTVLGKASVRKSFLNDSITLQSLDGTREIKSFANRSLTVIRVRDEYEVSNRALLNFQNSFTQASALPPADRVPGPLPILGAAAAFRLSRRLRARRRQPHLA